MWTLEGLNCNVTEIRIRLREKKPHHLKREHHATSTQAQKEKKLYRRLLFCAFQPDQQLQAYLTLAQSCFIKGFFSSKSSSLLSVICSMRSLDAHGFVQKMKMKLHESAGNEKIKQEQCIPTSFSVRSHPHSRDFETRPCCQCSKETLQLKTTQLSPLRANCRHCTLFKQ